MLSFTGALYFFFQRDVVESLIRSIDFAARHLQPPPGRGRADAGLIMLVILICKRRLADLIGRPAFSARQAAAVAVVADLFAVRSVFAVL